MNPNKILPPTPPDPTEKNTAATPPVYSSETYARLLEQENEQLRLKNHQLRQRLSCVESKPDVYNMQKHTRKEQAEGFGDALKRRDALVGEIAETIISAFQRYKQTIQEQGKEGEEIKVFNGLSGFDDVSPI